MHKIYLVLSAAFLVTSTACSDESDSGGTSNDQASSSSASTSSASSGGTGGSGGSGSSSVGEGGAGGAGATSGSGGAGEGGAGTAGGPATGAGGDPGTSSLGFFVSTPSDSGGDLGGIAGADATCQALAAEVGAGGRTWRAYLSTSTENARDRIGKGPWVNAKGVTVAASVEALHALPGGNPELFVDHEGNRINGQWQGSPTPNEHDMLTGSAADGTALADTCNDWTSSTATPGPQVGHSDGLGPNMNGGAPYNSWNSVHAPSGCSQQQLVAVGGAGRFYCFAAD
ncbi:hypothetical protein [Sorangium sp. So ce693]|uniref:hypothetical protein n=1 Tax=Sorangium sp. So ce693 TaxID=3133318 RepID=UPI003F5E85B1